MKTELTEILNKVKSGDISIDEAEIQIINLGNPIYSHWGTPRLEKIVYVVDDSEHYFLNSETNEKYSFNQLIQIGYPGKDIIELIDNHYLEEDKKNGHITEEEYLELKSQFSLIRNEHF